jgi:hypothetical protein
LRRRKFSRNASAWRSSRSASLAVGFLGVFVISALYRETVIGAVDILSADGIVRRVIIGRRSSVVERTIGNGEVESSILSGGTIVSPDFHDLLLFRESSARLFSPDFLQLIAPEVGDAIQHGPHTLIII